MKPREASLLAIGLIIVGVALALPMLHRAAWLLIFMGGVLFGYAIARSRSV